MAKVTGRVTLQVDGQTLLSKHGATLEYGGVKRTAVVGPGGVIGYTEEMTPPMIHFELAHTADTSLDQIANWTDSTAIFATDSGHSYVIAQAFNMEPPKLAEKEGTITCSISGVNAVPRLAMGLRRICRPRVATFSTTSRLSVVSR